DRPVVAAPGVGGGPAVEADVAVGVPAGGADRGARGLLERLVAHADLDRLVGCERRHHRAEGGVHGRQPVGPGLDAVRPGEPGGAVRLPLGGPAVALRRGGLHGVQSRRRFSRSPYASMRRSRRNGQPRRTPPTSARSPSPTSVSARSADARAMTRPNGSATNDWPQKVSRPSTPMRFTATTNTPLAIAWPRWTVSQASCSAASHSGRTPVSQPIAVG